MRPPAAAVRRNRAPNGERTAADPDPSHRPHSGRSPWAARRWPRTRCTGRARAAAARGSRPARPRPPARTRASPWGRPRHRLGSPYKPSDRRRGRSSPRRARGAERPTDSSRHTAGGHNSCRRSRDRETERRADVRDRRSGPARLRARAKPPGRSLGAAPHRERRAAAARAARGSPERLGTRRAGRAGPRSLAAGPVAAPRARRARVPARPRHGAAPGDVRARRRCGRRPHPTAPPRRRPDSRCTSRGRPGRGPRFRCARASSVKARDPPRRGRGRPRYRDPEARPEPGCIRGARYRPEAARTLRRPVPRSGRPRHSGRSPSSDRGRSRAIARPGSAPRSGMRGRTHHKARPAVERSGNDRRGPPTLRSARPAGEDDVGRRRPDPRSRQGASRSAIRSIRNYRKGTHAQAAKGPCGEAAAGRRTLLSSSARRGRRVSPTRCADSRAWRAPRRSRRGSPDRRSSPAWSKAGRRRSSSSCRAGSCPSAFWAGA